jgi:hypothetical protein
VIRLSWRSSFAAALLAVLALTGGATAASAATGRPLGKAPRLRRGISRRVAVDHPPPFRPSFASGNAATVPAGVQAGLAVAPIGTVMAPPTAPPPPAADCTDLVADLTAAEAAISTAASGAVVCLADGSYGELSLSAWKASEVTLRPAHAGGATIDGATLEGSHLTLARFEIGGEVTVQPGSTSIEIAHNRISGGYFGVDAGPTATTSVNDTAIVGNQFVGPFGEDAIHLNRYHDSNGDGIGVLIEGNEISGVRENGNHSDCLQTVWVGDHLVFRRNYLHDNRCQGFFVKDQDGPGEVSGPIVGIAVEDNLFLRDDAPCAAEAPDCGSPSYLHVFGPYSEFTMRRNTIWGGEPVASFQEGTGIDTTIESNVVYRFWTSTDLSGVAYADNTGCQREASGGGSWPSQVLGETVACSPGFNDPSVDDYSLTGSSRGVDWAPAAQQYGP